MLTIFENLIFTFLLDIRDNLIMSIVIYVENKETIEENKGNYKKRRNTRINKL